MSSGCTTPTLPPQGRRPDTGLRHSHPIGSILCSVLLSMVCVTRSTPSNAAQPSLQLTDCRLEAPDSGAAAGAKCGWFAVAENPAAPASRHIRLRVAVVPALNLRKAADPLVFLTGGPGEAASVDYLRLAPAFERIRRDRDILLIDQRGTGASNRLNCILGDELEVGSTEAQQIKALASRCLGALPGDPRYYTTSVAVADLEAVRVALGYSQLNLWGGSYGTRVAQHYLRRYPQRVRTVILDGVVPPPVILGPGVAVEAQRALDSIFARCTKEPACKAAFPELQGDYAALRSGLERQPVAVTIPDPVSARTLKLTFAPAHLINAIRLLSYSDATAALLPYLIHAANQQDLQPLAAQAVLGTRNVSNLIASGMAYSVQCSEDAPYLQRAAADDPTLAQTYIGRQFLDGFLAICSVWPRGIVDPDLHQPLHSQVPALLLSGENDPVTPPAYGAQAAAGFVHHKHLVLKGQGHIQTGTACVPRLVARFIQTADAEQLDTHCLDHVAAAPFMLSATATAP